MFVSCTASICLHIYYFVGEMDKISTFLLLVHLVCSSVAVDIFDQKFGIHYTHTGGSHFGQTLSLYSSAGDNEVLVGAPLDTIPGAVIPETGSTLRCKINLSSVNVSDCEVLDLLDILEEDFVESVGDLTSPLEEKKGMLMGSSLYSSPVSGRIITCAPLYKVITQEPVNHPVGLCHVLESINATSEIFSPCKKVSSCLGVCLVQHSFYIELLINIINNNKLIQAS